MPELSVAKIDGKARPSNSKPTGGLGFDDAAFCATSFGIGWASAMIGFLQTAVRLSHVETAPKKVSVGRFKPNRISRFSLMG